MRLREFVLTYRAEAALGTVEEPRLYGERLKGAPQALEALTDDRVARLAQARAA